MANEFECELVSENVCVDSEADLACMPEETECPIKNEAFSEVKDYANNIKGNANRAVSDEQTKNKDLTCTDPFSDINESNMLFHIISENFRSVSVADAIERVDARHLYTAIPAQKEYEIKAGDTLTKIAKDQVGEDVVPDKLEYHMQRIATINGITDKNKIKAGDKISLPGYIKDGETEFLPSGELVTYRNNNTMIIDDTNGGYAVYAPDGSEIHRGPNPGDNFNVTKDQGKEVIDQNGKKVTTWKDGTIKKESPDGSGSVHKPGLDQNGNPDGSYELKHWGPEDVDNYSIRRLADGSFERTDKVDAADHSDFQLEKLRLDQLANANLTAKEYQDFAKNMTAFENRIKDPTNQLDHESIAKSYHHIGRILEANADPTFSPIAQQERNRLARELMENAADPKAVDQGRYGTCNVTTIETRFLTNHPELVTELVADLAVKGSYDTKFGLKVQLSPETYKPASDIAQEPVALPDGKRNYASQIFQTAAVNIEYLSQGKGIAYELHDPSPFSYTDNGDRIIDYTKPTPEVLRNHEGIVQRVLGTDFKDFDGLTTDQIVNISNEISGFNERDFLLVSHQENSIATIRIGSEEELQKKLEEAKEHGQFPLIVAVDVVNEPFLSDAGNSLMEKANAGHVVTITDYDPQTGHVSVDNQWGSKKDHFGSKAFSVRDVLSGMESPQSKDVVELWRKKVEEERTNGKTNGSNELHLLYLENKFGEISDEQLDNAIVYQMLTNSTRWQLERIAGTNDIDEELRTKSKFRQMYKMIENKDEDRAKQIHKLLK